MKKYAMSLCFALSGIWLMAQSEIEPNDSFAQSNMLSEGIAATGDILTDSPGDNFDYYMFTIANYSSVVLTFTATGTVANNTYSDFIFYNTNQVGLSGFNSITVDLNETASQDYTYHCLAPGNYYVRINAFQAMSYSFAFTSSSPFTATETEPNNNFAQANILAESIPQSGYIQYANGATDNFDYYKLTLSNYGAIVISVNGYSTSNTTAYSDFVGYFGNESQFSGFNTFETQPGQNSTTQFTFHCLAPGDYYLRFESSGSCVAYDVSYEFQTTFDATEVEPNGSFAEANFLNEGETKSGYIQFSSSSTQSDVYDFYRFTLPNYGSIVVTVTGHSTSGSAAYSDFVGFFGNESGFSGFSTFETMAGESSETQFTFHCLAPGDYYLRFESSGCVAYEVSYEFTDTFVATESEPNDGFAQANLLLEDEVKNGYIQFLNSSTLSDPYDYYRIHLEEYGTMVITVNGYSTSSSTAYSDFVGYFSNQSQFSGFSAFVTPPGENSTTQFTFHCFAPGDYYLRFESSGCVAYDVSYELISQIESQTESEPNNSLSEAVLVSLNENATGHILYQNNPFYDGDDYFKVSAPDSSRIVLTANFFETSDLETAYLFLYAYNMQGNVIAYKPITVTTEEYIDSISVDCFSGDTVIFRITAYSCFAYEFEIHSVSRMPSASFTTDRLGNNIGFIPQFENVTSFNWSFDDGQTSTSQYPLHTYAFGNWEPQLIATNSICNFSDTSSVYFEISGVESYNPKRGGQGGITSMEIFGGSLSDETIVKLIRNGVELFPAETFANLDNNVFRANFALHEAELGFYDVEIAIPGLDPILFENGFEVVGFQYPFTTAELIGDTRALLNRDRPYKIVVTNTGNVTAEGVVVGFAAPAGVSVTMKQAMIVPPASGSMTVDANGESYTLDRSEYHQAFDSAFVFYPIDSLFGQAYQGSLASFVIPNIPAGHTFELPLIVNGNSGGVLDFYTFTYKPNLYSTVLMPQWYGMIDNRGMEAIKALDMDADGQSDISLSEALETLEVNRALIQAEANYASDVFWRWWDGLSAEDSTWYTLNSQVEAGITFGMKTGSELMQEQLELVTDDSVAIKNALASYFTTKTIIEGGHVLTDDWWPYYDLPEDNWWSDFPGLPQPSQAPQTYDWQAWQQYYNDYYNWYWAWQNYYYQWYLYYVWMDYYNKQQKQQQIVDQNPQYLLQPFLTLQPFPGQLYPWPGYLYPFEIKKKPILFAFSFDPNVIYGPTGVGEEQYVRTADKQFFGVSFENLPDATAAAQVVEVRDTLDLNVFDGETFEFADVMVAGQSIRVPRGRREFVLDFYPVENVSWKVRLNGDFDAQTGVIRWLLTTLDTLTESLPDFDGFLPPNVISPEGEGTVYYAVSPRTDLQSGTIMNSEATIYFDLNEPITTNTWSNVVDVDAPSSFLTASLIDNTTISIQMNGTDDGCGIARYNIFISYNNQPFELFTTTEGGNVELIGEPGITYGLYCEAVDSLGNGEVKDPVAEVEITTGIEELTASVTVFSVYPNPNHGEFSILPSAALHKSKLFIYNNLGKIVYQQNVNTVLGESIDLDLRSLPSGQYLIRLQTPNGGFAAQRFVSLD